MAGDYEYKLKSMHLDDYQRIFWDACYGSLSRGHGDIRASIQDPSEELLSQVGISSGYYRDRALEYVAVRQQFNKFVNRLALVDPSVPTYQRDTMLFCAPPHTRVDHNCGLKTATCEQSIFCPGCRVRTMENIFNRLRPHIKSVSTIAVLPIAVATEERRVPLLYDSTMLRDILNKIFNRRWHGWPYDAVWSHPRYVRRTDQWVMTAKIFVLVNDLTQLWDPEDKIDSTLSWKKDKASELQLARVVARELSYQAQMLFTNQFTDEELVQLRQSYTGLPGERTPLRTRFHGTTKPKKAMEPITIISEDIINDIREDNQCDIVGGLTPATADLEQPSRHTGGRMELIHPDSRSVFGES